MEETSRPPAQVIQLRGRRANLKRQRAEREIASLRSGSAAAAPIVVFCHIRGESEPFPRRWKWGTLRLGQGPPTWRGIWPRGKREPLALPAGTTQAGPPRAVLREELSAFCPNPRTSVVLPLDSPGGRIFVGLGPENVETLVAAIDLAPPSPAG